MNYTAAEVLLVAKRFNNTRRNYLLVNPLQGKHLPVSPTVALEMMNSLGQRVAEKFSSANAARFSSDRRLIIDAAQIFLPSSAGKFRFS